MSIQQRQKNITFLLVDILARALLFCNTLLKVLVVLKCRTDHDRLPLSLATVTRHTYVGSDSFS